MTGLERFYDACYATTDERFAGWRAVGARTKADHVVRLWRRRGLHPRRVVEIGCGDGALLAELAGRPERPPELDGYEITATAVELARARGLPGVRVEAYGGDRLPVDDGAYDVAILSHVLEHVAEPEALLAEAARVARWVVVEVPLEDNRSGRRPANKAQSARIGHLHQLDREAMHAICRRAGVTVADELTDPLPFAHHAYFAYTPSERVKAAAKTGVRWAIWRISSRVAEHVMTLHYACLASAPRP